MVPLQISEVSQHLALAAVNSLWAIVLSFHRKDQHKNAADQPEQLMQAPHWGKVKYQESQKFRVSHSCNKDVLACTSFVYAILYALKAVFVSVNFSLKKCAY